MIKHPYKARCMAACLQVIRLVIGLDLPYEEERGDLLVLLCCTSDQDGNCKPAEDIVQNIDILQAVSEVLPLATNTPVILHLWQSISLSIKGGCG